MGGISIFIITILSTILLNKINDIHLNFILYIFAFFMMTGLLDDSMKVWRFFIFENKSIFIPYFKYFLYLRKLFIPFIIFFTHGNSHSVNLKKGMD